MRQRDAPLVLPRRRTPFTRKRKMGPSSNALASRVCWRLTSAPRKSDCHREHARTSRWQHERAISPRACRHRVIGQKCVWATRLNTGTPCCGGTPTTSARCSCGRSTALELAQKRPHRAAFAIDREEGVVKPYSRLSLYKADRYRARDGKDWFPGAQASPKYAPSRSCRTNGRTSARIC